MLYVVRFFYHNLLKLCGVKQNLNKNSNNNFHAYSICLFSYILFDMY